MSDPAPEPVTPPAPEAGKYHFILIQDEGGSPVRLSSDDLVALQFLAYKHILAAQQGWCYFIIDGKICHISAPELVFQLRMPDGTLQPLKSENGPVFDSNGQFYILRGPIEPY